MKEAMAGTMTSSSFFSLVIAACLVSMGPLCKAFMATIFWVYGAGPHSWRDVVGFEAPCYGHVHTLDTLKTQHVRDVDGDCTCGMLGCLLPSASFMGTPSFCT